MCGIAGAYHLDQDLVDEATIMEVLKQLHHRGPDSNGTYIGGSCVLGHTRLAIIDPTEAGQQPFIDPTGRFALTFNGEIYNHMELRKGLSNVAFRSGTDTETLLHLFIKEGKQSLQKLNGFFAFAIHDRETDDLFIARDRMGIKPLWWSADESRLLFGSELRALMALGVKREIDMESLYMYFRFHYIAAPHSIFKGVNKLLPGHCISVKNKQWKVEQWYDPERSLVEHASPEKTIRELMETSVRERLMADVPLGTFLSGGLDSSIISALACRQRPDLNTFSIGFADDPFYDESKDAELTARHIGSTHHAFRLSNADLEAHYMEFIGSMDEPFADSSALPMYILCKRTREHVKVALSGDGADELFAGYRKHMAWHRMDHPGVMEHLVAGMGPLWNALPRSRTSSSSDLFRKLDRFAKNFKLPAGERYWELASFEEDAKAAQLLEQPYDPDLIDQRKEAILQRFRKDASLRSVLSTDRSLVLANDMLVKVDQMSMAHALEVRVPFLDHRVVEFANSLSLHHKIDRRQGKKILRSAFSNMLPQHVLERAKQGFEVPLGRVLMGELRIQLQDMFSNSPSNKLNSKGLDRIWEGMDKEGPGKYQATLHALIVFQAWWERWMT